MDKILKQFIINKVDENLKEDEDNIIGFLDIRSPSPAEGLHVKLSRLVIIYQEILGEFLKISRLILDENDEGIKIS